MRRALREYIVSGIKTTVPFFTWLLDQESFVDGAFHTTYLDDILRTRNGRPFVEPEPDVEEIAAIAAALQTLLSPSAADARTSSADAPRAARAWKTRARLEGLR
jgi:acetyl/propionyl-CoA carboxylase alpha subunit